MEFLQKRFATRRQSFFEPFRAIAIGARPGLGPVFVTTIAPRMRVFHRQEIKIFFPIGTLFLQAEDHKNKFLPNAPRPWHPRAPSACCTSTRRPRLTRDQGCDPRSPWPTRPHIRISPGPSPNNALQNLHAARPSVIPSAVGSLAIDSRCPDFRSSDSRSRTVIWLLDSDLVEEFITIQRCLDFARHDN